MNFSEIKNKIINNTSFESLQEIKQAGYRIVKERDSDRYFLAKSAELKPLLVKLGDIAEVRRGFTTGANEFFYLQSVGAPLAVAQSPNHTGATYVKNAAGWEGFIEEEFLKLVIKSPRECKSILVNPKDLKYKIFMCHKTKKELQGARALEYIEWGEKQGYHTRPSCKGRPRWWDLGIWKYPDMIWSDAYNDRYATFLVPNNHYGDKRFFYIYPQSDELFKIARLYLNSTIIALIIEIEGISNLGEGVIYTNVYWLKKLLVMYTDSIALHRIQGLFRYTVPFAISRSYATNSHSRSYALRGNANFASQTLQRQRAGLEPAPTNSGNNVGVSIAVAQSSTAAQNHGAGVKPAPTDTPNHRAGARPAPTDMENTAFLTREIQSIFTELGINPTKPIRSQKPNPLPDRKALDDIVFDILGLTQQEREEVYLSVCELVHNRLSKARSV